MARQYRKVESDGQRMEKEAKDKHDPDRNPGQRLDAGSKKGTGRTSSPNIKSATFPESSQDLPAGRHLSFRFRNAVHAALAST